MSDMEWNRWKERFQAHEADMSELRSEVLRTRRKQWLSWALFAVIGLFEVGCAIDFLFFSGDDLNAKITGVFLLVFVSVMGTLFTVLQRGSARAQAMAPSEMLAWLEGHLRRAEQAALLGRWGGVVAGLFTEGLMVFSSLTHGFRPLPFAMGTAFVVAVIVGTWISPSLARRSIAPRRERLRAWRAQLEETA